MARAEFTVGMDDNVIRNLALSAAVQAIGPRSISMVEVHTSEILKMAGEFEKFLRGPGEAAKKEIIPRCPNCGSTDPRTHQIEDASRACPDNFHKAVATCGGCGEPKSQGDHGPGVCV
jgi:hypothetical protein